MQIPPTGEERTMTRAALLAYRAVEERRLRERWAQEKADKEKGNRDDSLPSPPR